MEDSGKDAFGIWERTAPISNDPRTKGDLRSMFRAPIEAGEFNVTLTLNAYAPHAVFVELGTVKMPPQSPLRTTAGLVADGVPTKIHHALMEL